MATEGDVGLAKESENNSDAKLGGIQEVKDFENDLKFDSLARFAVDDYNKKHNALLEFVRVVNVKQQVVAGMLYYITLEAKDGDQKKLYETKIWVKEWQNFKEVLEFKPLILDASTA